MSIIITRANFVLKGIAKASLGYIIPSTTPTPTPTIACYEYVATADQTDIDNSDNGTVYFEYIDCDGVSQTLTRGTTTPSNPVCARSVGTVYILIGGNQSVTSNSLWSSPGTLCNPGGGGGGEP